MKILPAVILLAIFFGCSNSSEPTQSTSNTSSSVVPVDHTVSEKGVMHKSGLNSASTNCISCHCSDLKGGSAGISCYSCHSKLWN